MAQIRQKIWKAKTPWFVAAAAILFLCSIAMFLRYGLDTIKISGMQEVVSKAEASIKQGESFKVQLVSAQSVGEKGNADNNFLALQQCRHVWPFLVNDTYEALASSKPSEVEVGSDPNEIRKIPIDSRRLVRLEDFSGVPSFISETNQRKIVVSVRVTVTNKDPVRFINETNGVLDWLKGHKDRPEAPYIIDADSVKMPRWTKIQGGVRSAETPVNNANESGDSGMGGFASGEPVSGANSTGSGGSALRKAQRDGPLEDKGGGFRGGIGAGSDASSDPSEVVAGDSGVGNAASGAGSGKRRTRTIVVSIDEKLPAVDLAKEAPLPIAPVLVDSNDIQYEGILEFTVILKFPLPIAAVPAETQ